jgi:hypothetical protein
MCETGRKLTNFLFSVFLNDLEYFLSESNISPLEQIQEKNFQELNTLISYFICGRHCCFSGIRRGNAERVRYFSFIL